MIHVKQIKTLVDSGQRDEALAAIENLLVLGPSNLEALKIKAFLMESAGKFEEEYKIWQRVLEVDSEDQEAMAYLFRKQMEDREHFHFSEKLQSGCHEVSRLSKRCHWKFHLYDFWDHPFSYFGKSG